MWGGPRARACSAHLKLSILVQRDAGRRLDPLHRDGHCSGTVANWSAGTISGSLLTAGGTAGWPAAQQNGRPPGAYAARVVGQAALWGRQAGRRAASCTTATSAQQGSVDAVRPTRVDCTQVNIGGHRHLSCQGKRGRAQTDWVPHFERRFQCGFRQPACPCGSSVHACGAWVHMVMGPPVKGRR